MLFNFEKVLTFLVYFATLLGFAHGRIFETGSETESARSLLDDEEMINVIVKYKDNLSRSSSSSSSSPRWVPQGGVLNKRFRRVNADALSIPAKEMATLESNPDVEYVEEDHMMYRSSEYLGYGVTAIQANTDKVPSPDLSAGCFNICVIDSGLLIGHPDIPYSMQQNNVKGAEFGLKSNEKWFNPLDGHGTHVTGTIIAQGDNDLGIVGVIPDNNNICLLIARAFGDADGGALSSSVDAALEWCGENDARVINMSLGSGFASRTQQVIIQDLEDQEVLVVAAAGNDGNTDTNYPAGYPQSMSVGAVDSNLRWASFSQFNSEVDVCAPGVRINSTVPSIAISDNSNGAKYDASLMEGSSILSDILEGDLADCGLGLERCQGVSGKICFIERGDATFGVKATNCEDGGGIGAIIFNNVGSSDIVSGTLGGVEVSIPVLAISRTSGLSFSLASLPSATIDVRSASYLSKSGTSMAAPHATGVVARIWSVRPQCTSAQVREAVENSAFDLGDEGRDDKYGAGLVQMEAAYEYLLSFDAPCGSVEVSTELPTIAPTKKPSKAPTIAPTKMPTNKPTLLPTGVPTSRPNPKPAATRRPTFTFSPVPAFQPAEMAQTPQSLFSSPPVGFSFYRPPTGSSPTTGLSFSGPSPFDIFFQTDSASTSDEAVTDGSEGDRVSNSMAYTSSAYNGLPCVGRVGISMLMAILLTVV